MLYMKTAAAFAAAALIRSAASSEAPEVFGIPPSAEEFYAAAAIRASLPYVSAAAVPPAAAAAVPAAAAAPPATLHDRLQTLQDELRAWKEAQQNKMRTSQEELVGLWRAAAAAAQERIRLSQEMQAMNKEAVKELLEAFFEWLRKLMTPVPIPSAAPLGSAEPERETDREAERSLSQEAEALLQAIQEILKKGCEEDADQSKRVQQEQQQQQQQKLRPQPRAGAEQPQQQQQEEEQQEEPAASVVRGASEETPEETAEETPEETAEKLEGSEQQQRGSDDPIDPEFSYPGPEQALPEPEGEAEEQQQQRQSTKSLLLLGMHSGLLGAAVTQSVARADAMAQQIAAAAEAAAAAGPFRSSISQNARQILQELEEIKSSLAQLNAAAAAELNALNAAAPQQSAAAAEEQRLNLLRNWLVAINVFQIKLLHLSTRAQQLGIVTPGSNATPPIAQGYPLPKPEVAPREYAPSSYSFYPY